MSLVTHQFTLTRIDYVSLGLEELKSTLRPGHCVYARCNITGQSAAVAWNMIARAVCAKSQPLQNPPRPNIGSSGIGAFSCAVGWPKPRWFLLGGRLFEPRISAKISTRIFYSERCLLFFSGTIRSAWGLA